MSIRVHRKDIPVYKKRLWRLCPQVRYNLTKPKQPIYSAEVPTTETNFLPIQTFITYYSFPICITLTCKGVSALAQCSLQCEIWGFVLFSLVNQTSFHCSGVGSCSKTFSVLDKEHNSRHCMQTQVCIKVPQYFPLKQTIVVSIAEHPIQV